MDGPKLFDLTGKTALVTGSSEGLGLAMARGLAAAGASLILNGRDEQKLANAAKSFAESGHKIETRPFDVADEGAVIAAFEHFDAAGVEIDILVNNAGIQFRKPMVDLKTDEWRRVVEIHLTGAFQVGREAAKRMIARGRGGKIINIASLASEVARATISPYVAAKGGIRMLTRSMAAEWAKHDIQANAIGPGPHHPPRLYRDRNEPGADRRPQVRRLGQRPYAVGTVGQAGGPHWRHRVPRLAGLGLC